MFSSDVIIATITVGSEPLTDSRQLSRGTALAAPGGFLRNLTNSLNSAEQPG
jgi:hypothetical protein